MQQGKKLVLQQRENGSNVKIRTRGQGLVEFALTLPILLMLLLGIMEFGRMLFVYSSVVSAVREAARYGAATGTSASGNFYYQDCDGIRDAAVRIGGLAGVTNTETSVLIEYDKGPSPIEDTIDEICPVGGTGPILQKGDRIVVTVLTVFVPTQGLLPLPTLPIQSVVRRTIVTNISVW